MIFICQSTWCECSAHIDRYHISHLHHNQEITYFIHSTQIENGSIDVVIPRYLTYDKRYVQRMNEEKPLPLYYLCLSKLLTFYCGCIQTQLSYRKRKYPYYLSLVWSSVNSLHENNGWLWKAWAYWPFEIRILRCSYLITIIKSEMVWPTREKTQTVSPPISFLLFQ